MDKGKNSGMVAEGRRGKGDRGLGDDACVSGLSNARDVPQAAVYPMGLQLSWELDMDI